MSDPKAYVILISPTLDGGYGAWAPDLPGCIALGDTVEETEHEVREAIAFTSTASVKTAFLSLSR